MCYVWVGGGESSGALLSLVGLAEHSKTLWLLFVLQTPIPVTIVVLPTLIP